MSIYPTGLNDVWVLIVWLISNFDDILEHCKTRFDVIIQTNRFLHWRKRYVYPAVQLKYGSSSRDKTAVYAPDERTIHRYHNIIMFVSVMGRVQVCFRSMPWYIAGIHVRRENVVARSKTARRRSLCNYIYWKDQHALRMFKILSTRRNWVCKNKSNSLASILHGLIDKPLNRPIHTRAHTHTSRHYVIRRQDVDEYQRFYFQTCAAKRK